MKSSVFSTQQGVRPGIILVAALGVVGLSFTMGCETDTNTTSSSSTSSSSSSSSSSGEAGAGGTGGMSTGGMGGMGGTGGTGGTAGMGGTGGAGGGMNAIAPVIIPASENGHDRFLGVTHDAQGNIYAVGIIADGADMATDFKTLVAKFLPNGDLDMTFGNKGFATHNVAVGTGGEVARGIVVQSTGKIVVAGQVEHAGASDMRDRDIYAARFNADGTLDMSFGTNGVALLDLSDGELVGTTYIADQQWGLSRYSDDKLLITGAQKAPGRTDLDFASIRLEANGAVDTTFGTMGVTLVDINQQGASPRTANILGDGSAVVAGYTRDIDGVVSPVLYKLTPAGQLDTTFGANGIFNQIVLGLVTEAYAAVVQGTSFVTAGYGRNSMAENLDWVSLRITGNGTLDMSYGEMGVARLDVNGQPDNARSLVALPDNRLLLVGGGRNVMDDSDAMIAILTENGKVDTIFETKGFKTFDLGGTSDFFWGVDVAPDKKSIAVVGAKGGMGDDDAAILLMPAAL